MTLAAYAMLYVAFFGGLGLGSKHSELDSESLSLLLLVSLGGSGWSDFELLDRLDRVPYSQISIAGLVMCTLHCRYIQLPNKAAHI